MKGITVNYIREMKGNYMTVQFPEAAAEGYEGHMLESNHIPGLLKVKVKYEDGNLIYCYDITSRQPLSRLLESRAVTREEIGYILIQLHDALTAMERYFLRGDGILLEPEYIYVEPELFQVGFCYLPGGREDFYGKLSLLLQVILKHIDHRNRECVVLAYGLYQESLKENYGMEDLMALLPGDGEKRAEPVKKEAENEYENENHAFSKRQEEVSVSQDTYNTDLRDLILKQTLFWLAASLLVPLLIWILRGTSWLLELSYLLMGASAMLLMLFAGYDFIFFFFKKRKAAAKEKEEKPEESSWRILYEDDEETEEEEKVEVASMPAREAPAQETFQTVLLSDCSFPGSVHRLEGIGADTEDIPIPYFPFIIGKHKGLADYVLDKDTVSRFHLRCDKQAETCTITDLNSTNGTSVRGRLLAANETAEVNPGDEVEIAQMRYIWR